MGLGSIFERDERGVSNVVAVTLLVGLTLVGVVIILATGFVTIGDTNQQASLELAEESMLQIESALQQESEDNTTIRFPDQLEGQVAVSNDQQYTLTLNDNRECRIDSRPLSSVEYEDNQETVAYEGGGVWRMTESGATMVSPPDVSYDEGALAVSFTEINGTIQTTDELRVTGNTTNQRIHQYNLSRALYEDGTYDTPSTNSEFECNPSTVENATLQINDSQYARAWADWARNNHDTDLVTVTPSGTVEPGDNITIIYPLNDVSPADFRVSDVRATRSGPSDDVTVSGTVSNEGGLRSTQTVYFNYSEQSGPAVYTAQKDVNIGGDRQKRVSFDIPDGVLETGPRDINITANNTAKETLNLGRTDGVPATELDISDVPNGASVGASPSGAHVEVENTGEMTAFEQVNMSVDGNEQATEWVTVPPTGSTDWSVKDDLPTGDIGTHTLKFTGKIASNTPSKDFTVGENGYFGISSVSPPTDVDAGQSVTVEATIENTGAEDLRDEIFLNVTNLDTDTEVKANDPERGLDGTVSRSTPDSDTVSLTTNPLTVGNYSYLVKTPNETQSGQFYVGPASGPNFVITKLTVSDDPVDLGNQTTVNVEVTNTGTEGMTQDIRLTNNNTNALIDSEEDLSLNAGENHSMSWTFGVDNSDFSTGTNRLNISTENVTLPTNLNVRDPESFSANGGTISVTEAVNASITMEGAELEYNDFGCVDYETRETSWGYEYVVCAETDYVEESSPTEMVLAIENDTGWNNRTLWTDVPGTGANVNSPLAEKRMYRDDVDNPYTEFLSLEPGTNVSLYATSYTCPGSEVDSGIDHIRGEDNNAYNGYKCSEDIDDIGSDDKILRIGNATNPDNVVIRGNGDDVPQYNPGFSAQLTLDQMLGSDRIQNEGGEGVLSLDQDEEVFLFELNEEDAFPGNENKPVTGDYNDAVARFEVIEDDKNVTLPAEFDIVEVDLPARVTTGTEATMDVTVRNTGGKVNSTPVEMKFDGGSQVETATTDDLANNETDTVSFDVHTNNRTAGSYDWTVSATKTAGAQQSGFITVGDPLTPFFQVSGVSGPAVADIDDSPTANITITNTGSVEDTQQIVLYATNADDGSTYTADTSLELDPRESGDVTLNLPTTKGNYTYEIRTDNVTTTPQAFLMGESNVYVPSTDSISIGAGSYPTNTLIERTGNSLSTITVEVENDGTVGDTRDVRLEIDGTTIDRTKQVGGGSLVGDDPVPAFAEFDGLGLTPGYYDYTITVYSDKVGESVDYEVTGEIYLREPSGDGGDGGSPISVDSGTITVG